MNIFLLYYSAALAASEVNKLYYFYLFIPRSRVSKLVQNYNGIILYLFDDTKLLGSFVLHTKGNTATIGGIPDFDAFKMAAV